MINSVRSELVKLKRRNAILGYAGAAVGFTTLLTIVSITNIGNPNARGPGSSSNTTLEQLAEPSGYAVGFEAANNFLGIIALALFASSIAAEFSTGTIRSLLVIDSRRRLVLAGKTLALMLFWIMITALSIIMGGVVARLMSNSQGIDPNAWLTAEGIGGGLSIWVNVTIATLGWGLFGGLLAMLSRSASLAIAGGVGYFLIGEHLILQSLWPSTADWLPAGVFTALAQGGTPTVTFMTALGMTALYGAAAYLVTCFVFGHRDVTD